MKHSRDYANLLSDAAFEISARVRRHTNSLFIWLREAWVRAWKDVFDILALVASLLLNRQVWAITILLGMVWLVVAGPSLLERVVNIDEWQITSCDFKVAHVFVNAPRSIAPGDQRYFEITVQNEADLPLNNVRVSVKSTSGLLLFEEASTVTIETLRENEASTRVLRFRVANFQPFKEIPVVVAYHSESESEQLESQYCSQKLTLLNSTWRRVVVQLKAAPNVLDAGAKYIGYLGTLITGLLAITGKIGPVVRGVVSVLRSSGPEANGHES